MTPSLTPQQREEVLKAAFDALWPLQNWEMDPQVCRAAAAAALDAALPVIRRSCLEEAARVAGAAGRQPVGASDGSTYVTGTAIDAMHALRALAEETR
jgi:hypothetical protein